MAASEGVGTAQGDDFSVIETHASKNGAQVLLLFGTIGKSAIGSAHGDVAILAARAPGDGGTLHFLDGADATEGPEIGIGDPREFFLDPELA